MTALHHTTVNGTRYGIDADGRVLAPDADGRSDQIELGSVSRCAANPRWWVADAGPSEPLTDHGSRREAIANLARTAS